MGRGAARCDLLPRLRSSAMDADFWDRVYGSAEHAYGTSPNDFVHALAARIPAGPVL